jgi:hypothetical protein
MYAEQLLPRSNDKTPRSDVHPITPQWKNTTKYHTNSILDTPTGLHLLVWYNFLVDGFHEYGIDTQLLSETTSLQYFVYTV